MGDNVTAEVSTEINLKLKEKKLITVLILAEHKS